MRAAATDPAAMEAAEKAEEVKVYARYEELKATQVRRLRRPGHAAGAPRAR
jgi:hypothetical protein